MANTINTSFATQFSAEVKLAYDQNKPKIVPATDIRRNVKGSVYQFENYDTSDAVARPGRNQDLTIADMTHTPVTATLVDRYHQQALDDFDEFKTNVDVRRAYIRKGVQKIAKAQDVLAVAGLDAATMATGHTVDATAGLTKSKILEVNRVLDEAEVPNEDRFIVVSPQQVEAALALAEVGNADFQIANAMQGLLTGTLTKAFGLTWIKSNYLTVNTGVIDCYAFDRNAVGTAMGADITTNIGWDERMQATLFTAKTSLATAVIDTAGVVKVQCTES